MQCRAQMAQVIHPTFKVDELERTINGIKASQAFEMRTKEAETIGI